GASAVNPYLAFETLADMKLQGVLPIELPYDQAEKNYIKAVSKGLLKTFAKMGISTLQSYRGAQIFEAVGLCRELVDAYFTGTPSQIGGIGLDVIQKEALARHAFAYPPIHIPDNLELDPGGQYQWRRGGEFHQYNPDTVAKLQRAVRTAMNGAQGEREKAKGESPTPNTNSESWQKGYKTFKEFTEAANDTSRGLA